LTQAKLKRGQIRNNKTRAKESVPKKSTVCAKLGSLVEKKVSRTIMPMDVLPVTHIVP
jgi:hypothetical protein